MSNAINFRSTLGFATDAANEVHCIGDAYPVTRGSAPALTFGWAAACAASDRGGSADRRLVGTDFVGTGDSASGRNGSFIRTA